MPLGNQAEGLLGVALGLDGADRGNFSLFIDDDRGADDAGGFFAVHHFFTVGAIGLVDFEVRIGEEGKVEFVVFAKFLVTLQAVSTDAEHDRIFLFEILLQVAKVAGLNGATGCVVFGVKIQDDLLSFQLTQADLAVRVRFEGKGRSLVTDF